MQIPGLPSLLFLFYLLIVLPWMAFKSHQKMDLQSERNVNRFSNEQLEKIWISTLFNFSLMFALSWAAGSGFGFRIFALPDLSAQVVLAAISVLLLCLLIRMIARRTRSLSERKKLVVYALSPRTRRQWILKSLVVVSASVAEETAYRGVAWQLLSYITGQHLLASIISSVAFAFAHWVQGWVSMLIIFIVAVLMHGLVQYSSSLIPAMLVHGIYDFIAIFLISREASRYRQANSSVDSVQSPQE